MLLQVLGFLFLLGGCGSLEDCLDDCDDNSDRCIENGSSEGACKAEQAECERQCRDSELRNESNDGEIDG